jgi:hypothetical protein
MRVDVMRPAYNLEPKYRVMALTREDWTTCTGTPPIVKEHVWYTDGSRMRGDDDDDDDDDWSRGLWAVH